MDNCMTNMQCSNLAEVVQEMSRRLDRLKPSRRDPEAYFAEKADLVADLRKLGEALRSRGTR